MTDEPINKDGCSKTFPGWKTDLDLRDLVKLIEPVSLAERPEIGAPEVEPLDATGGSLLAGRGIAPSLGQSTAPPPTLPKKSDTLPASSKISVSEKPTGRRSYVWLIGLGIAAVVTLILLAFALMVMKSTDFRRVSTFEGRYAEEVRLTVRLGEKLPDFSGLLLVANEEKWGQAFSSLDLLGQNTVLYVWGSWNENLVTWSQELNYIRLVDFESFDVQFVGLNLDSSKDVALAAINEELVGWPHVFNQDERQATGIRPMEVLGIESSPVLLLVDATGRLRALGLDPDELVEAYGRLFQ